MELQKGSQGRKQSCVGRQVRGRPWADKPGSPLSLLNDNLHPLAQTGPQASDFGSSLLIYKVMMRIPDSGTSWWSSG